MKDIIIPTTGKKFGIYLTFILTGLSWAVMIYYFIVGFPDPNTSTSFPFALAGAGIIMGTIMSVIFAGFLYDLNPIHWIGYNIKFRDDK